MRDFSTIVFLANVLFFSSSLMAIEVSKVKGNKVLIQLEDQQVNVGDEFFALNADGKKKGLITIKQIRDERAIGILNKGQAEPGWTLTKRIAKKKTARQSSAAVDNESGPHEKAYYGLQIGYSLVSMSVDETSSTTISMNGGSLSVRGIFDYGIFDRIWFRGGLGYQGFDASSSSLCTQSDGSQATCNIDVNYLDFDFLARYLFSMGYFRPWLGVGFGLLFPLSKSTTAILPSTVTNTSIIEAGAGLDWFVTNTVFIPVQVEYGFIQRSSQVTNNLITMRAGVGLSF
jgi:opacity protein-like surface antigen